MRYKDINGKISNKQLMGTSGKTYGNINLYSSSELNDILADGITEVQDKPARVTPDSVIESRRISSIKNEAREQIFDRVTGTTDFQNAILKEVNKLVKGVLLLNSVVDKSSLSVEETAEIDSLINDASTALSIRTLSNDAETNGDSTLKYRYDIEQLHGVQPNSDYHVELVDGNYELVLNI